MQLNKANLSRGITLAADILAREIRRRTSIGGPGGYPSQIPASITVEKAIVTDTGASIAVSSIPNDSKKQAPAITRAFESGSGKFGKRGAPYKITPKKSRFLAFPGSKWMAYMEPPKKPLTFVLPEVEHPGIRPRPFLIDSFEAVADGMLDVIGQNFNVEIFDGPKIEVIK